MKMRILEISTKTKKMLSQFLIGISLMTSEMDSYQKISSISVMNRRIRRKNTFKSN